MFQVTALRDLRREVDASSVAALRQLRDVLEQRFSELDAMAVRISSDPRLTVFQLRQTGYSRLEAVRELVRYASSAAVLLDIILLPQGESDVFMSTGSMSWNRFVDAVASFEHLSPDLIRRLVNDSAGPVMLPVQEYRLGFAAERVLVLIYPIPPRSPHPHATILYLIRETEVVTLMANALPESDGAVALIDSSGTVLVSHPHPHEVLSPAAWQGIVTNVLDGSDETTTTIETEDGDFTIAAVSSSYGEWRFITVVGREAHQIRVTEMRNKLMFFALALAVVGVLVSFWFSWSTYSPIRALQDFAVRQRTQSEPTVSHPSISSRFTEIEAILVGISDAYKARDRLASAIESQRPLARAQLLTRLLQGIDEEVFQSLGPSGGVSFPHSHYFVFQIAITARNSTSAWEREAVIQSVSEFGADDYIACGVEVNRREAIAVIVNLAPIRSEKSLQRRIVSAALTRLGGLLPSTPSVAVGLVHLGIQGIAKSYVEAMAASDYTAADEVRLQFFADITGPAARLPRLPLQLRLRLLQAVKEGQVDLAIGTLHDIERTIEGVVHSEESRLEYLRELASAVRDIPRHLALKYPIESTPDISGDIDGVAALVQTVCRLVVVDRSSSVDRMVSHVVEFVESNYGDAGLSLVLVADRFGLSLSHLSRVFKEQTGKTFSEYISDLRIERMMVLLRSTDFTVREIVARVGYHDVPNCIRKFRQVVGVTPGKYRKGSDVQTSA